MASARFRYFFAARLAGLALQLGSGGYPRVLLIVTKTALTCPMHRFACLPLLIGFAAGSGLGPAAQENLRFAAAQQSPPTSVSDSANSAQQVVEIRILGNDTIPASQVAGHLSTRVGRPFDRAVVQGDVRRLANLGWFVDVKPLYETVPGGQIIIFQVVERPTIRYVTYLGNKKISDKNLGKQTGIKAGGAVDPYAVEEGRRKIEEHYQSRGFNTIRVTILEGSEPTDQGIVYLINEGQKQRIWEVDFIGNEFVSDGRLKSLIESKPPTLKLFKGYLNQELIDADVDKLTSYYRAFGFFQAKVGRKLDYNEPGDWVNLTFVIHEGMRYKIRNVQFVGNTKFDPTALASTAKLSSDQPFEQAKMQRDAAWLKELYGSQGYVFTDVRPETVFLEEPGDVDLVYHIDEGQRFRVGRVLVHIGGDNPHTRIQTALNRMTIRPGDIMDIRELKASERRLMASSLFLADAATGIRPKITYRISSDADISVASRPRRRSTPKRSPGPPMRAQGSGMRGQSPTIEGPPVLPPPPIDSQQPHVVRKPDEQDTSNQPADIHVHCQDMEHYHRWMELETELQRVPDQPATGPAEQPHTRPSAKQPDESKIIIRGQSPDSYSPVANSTWTSQPAARQQAANPYHNLRGQSPTGQLNAAYSNLPVNNGGSPYGGRSVRPTGPDSAPPRTTGNVVQQTQYSESIPPPAAAVGGPVQGFPANSVPGYQIFPDGRFGLPGQPYPEQTVDVIFQGQETQTGRLMLGVGVNSDAGLVGNIVLDERNFDWRRPPRSWEDIRNGTALRGAGQRFRIDASPGSEVNRYLASFQEPYLFDSPISLGLSGSYFDRRFRDWDEQRLGGRVSLGWQWVEHDLSAALSYRGENVNVSDVRPGAPPDLTSLAGDNQLHGFRLTVVNDTRDSTFLPTQGHYFEVSGEQVIGTFDYPRLTADFRKYWLMRERPDHSGRHVLSASTVVGYSGTQTPVYDRFFAGGFSTMRGFDFRGASPVFLTGSGDSFEIGGDFQWLNSVQYLFPITADEMLHGVVFCDFGTVEEEVEIDDFRVAPGVGLRVTVPAMGPAPIALDFAWAVNHADFDDREVFSFSLGFSR